MIYVPQSLIHSWSSIKTIDLLWVYQRRSMFFIIGGLNTASNPLSVTTQKLVLYYLIKLFEVRSGFKKMLTIKRSWSCRCKCLKINVPPLQTNSVIKKILTFLDDPLIRDPFKTLRWKYCINAQDLMYFNHFQRRNQFLV